MPPVGTQAGSTLDRGELLRRAVAVGLAPWWRVAQPARDPRVVELDKLLTGDVVGRGDPGYAGARVLFDTSFDAVRPIAIAYCAGPGDIARALAWARKRGIRIAPRCGGHSYGGYSTTPGVVLDV